MSEGILHNLLLDLLVNNRSILTDLNVSIPEHIQAHLISILHNHTEIFASIQSSLTKIVTDGKIDTKDTPEILFIVGKIYELVYKSKYISKKDDYNEIVSNLFYISAIAWLRHTGECNKEIVENLSTILSASIELIKLKSSIKPIKKFKLF